MAEKTMIKNAIPDDVLDLFTDLEFYLDVNGHCIQDQIRFMGLFMYKRLKEANHTISSQQLNFMLSALQQAGEHI